MSLPIDAQERFDQIGELLIRTIAVYNTISDNDLAHLLPGVEDKLVSALVSALGSTATISPSVRDSVKRHGLDAVIALHKRSGQVGYLLDRAEKDPRFADLVDAGIAEFQKNR